MSNRESFEIAFIGARLEVATAATVAEKRAARTEATEIARAALAAGVELDAEKLDRKARSIARKQT